MKINNDKQPKINIIKGNIGNKKENDKKIGKNIAEKSQKNKFNIPNMNNSEDYYNKIIQNIQYQNYINQKMAPLMNKSIHIYNRFMKMNNFI